MYKTYILVHNVVPSQCNQSINQLQKYENIMRKANLIINLVLTALVLGNMYAWSCAIIAELEKPLPEVEEPTSWEVYCAKYGVDEQNPTSEQETYYMDCYAGSVEEEEDMNSLNPL